MGEDSVAIPAKSRMYFIISTNANRQLDQHSHTVMIWHYLKANMIANANYIANRKAKHKTNVIQVAQQKN